jgi:hypothetical protein
LPSVKIAASQPYLAGGPARIHATTV